jgi:hypothetical protein
MDESLKNYLAIAWVSLFPLGGFTLIALLFGWKTVVVLVAVAAFACISGWAMNRIIEMT